MKLRIGTVTVLTVLAAALRIPLLSRPLGSDEAASFLYYASHPLSVALMIYGSPNNHILHSALMHLAYQFFGKTEWALRLPAFLAGLAIVPLTFVASLSLASRGALIATALAATAPVLVDYSTDGRGYTMLCCFALICAIAMAEIVRSGRRSSIVLFAVSAALGFYTIPVMLYPFAMLVVWGLIAPHRREAAVAAAGAILLTVMLYLPVLEVSGLSMLISNRYVRPVQNFVSGALPYFATMGHQLFVAVPIAIQIAIAIGFVVALVRRAVPPFWIGILAVIAIVTAQRVLPFPRIWLPFLLLLFVTAAAAWPWGERSEAAVAAAVAIVLAVTGIIMPRLRETGELPEVGRIAQALNRYAQPGDPVLALPPSEMPLAFYCPKVNVLRPNPDGPRLFVVENRPYGQTLKKTLSFFRVDPRRYSSIRRMNFGESALYELRR